MQLQQIYFWSKKIHKWLLWFVAVFGSWMMLSGYLMHKEIEGEPLVSVQTMMFFRDWHNRASQYFLILFGVQMVTGILIWAVGRILKSRALNKVQ